MKTTKYGTSCVAAFAVALALAAYVHAGTLDLAPDKPVGISGLDQAVGTIDLARYPLFGGIGEYELRSRIVDVAPGGAIASHAHAGSPAFAILSEGVVIEYGDTAKRAVQPGALWVHDAPHWYRNPSTTQAAELWVVDLVAKTPAVCLICD